MSPFQCSMGYQPPVFPVQKPEARVSSASAFVLRVWSEGMAHHQGPASLGAFS